ncbi:MAG TPA: hypothetical protein VLG11_02955 [Candidatus Saccharimonadales bacterium]|nr:hypothetical protein [Candidatus Saccharimonadales bacterium]
MCSRNVLGIGRPLLGGELIESSHEQLQKLGFSMEVADGEREWSVKFVTKEMLGSSAVDAADLFESYRASDAYDATVSDGAYHMKIGKFVVRRQLVVRRVLPDTHLKRREAEPLLKHCMPDMPAKEVYNQLFYMPVGHLDLSAIHGDRNELLNALDAYQNGPDFALQGAAFGPLQIQRSA